MIFWLVGRGVCVWMSRVSNILNLLIYDDHNMHAGVNYTDPWIQKLNNVHLSRSNNTLVVLRYIREVLSASILIARFCILLKTHSNFFIVLLVIHVSLSLSLSLSHSLSLSRHQADDACRKRKKVSFSNKIQNSGVGGFSPFAIHKSRWWCPTWHVVESKN